MNSVLDFLLNHADLFRILPEVVLTLTGVVVMLIDATLPFGFPRRYLGMIAAIGTTLVLGLAPKELVLVVLVFFVTSITLVAGRTIFDVSGCGVRKTFACGGERVEGEPRVLDCRDLDLGKGAPQ